MRKKIAKKYDLVSLADINKSELFEILSLAKKLKTNINFKSNFLKGKNIALIFAKPSLRTRVSFEVGINQLGGNPITIKMEEISVGTRETTIDIANVLSRYVNAIVIRTFEQKQIEDLAKFSKVPVINALTNEEHPCQVISDLFTIHEIFGTLKGLKLCYVGDGNNVTHSLLIGCALAGLNISIASPKGYMPDKYFVELSKKINPKCKITLTTNTKEAVKNADIIYTDVWTSMGQEKEAKKRNSIFIPYQINDKLLSYAAKNAIVLHCLPAHKEQEIAGNTFDRFSEIIYTQAENRLHVQKAILIKLLSRNN